MSKRLPESARRAWGDEVADDVELWVLETIRENMPTPRGPLERERRDELDELIAELRASAPAEAS